MKEFFDVKEFSRKTCWELTDDECNVVIRLYDNIDCSFDDFCNMWMLSKGEFLAGIINAMMSIYDDMEIMSNSYQKKLAKCEEENSSILVEMLTENPNCGTVYNYHKMEEIICLKAKNRLPFSEYDLQYLKEHLNG